MVAYYNEKDEFAAQWLRNLIVADMIAPGDVDERDIQDVVPLELHKYTQCHFFAGIGVWSYSMRRAGWSDDRRGWTGSCPCQPFSQAGEGAGFADERHLWPAFFHLIEQCEPDVVFGEQVASKDGLAWLDLVQSDMEAANYAFGALDICAAGCGAPHIRQRLYWMADLCSSGLPQQRCNGGISFGTMGTFPRQSAERGSAPTSGMADAGHVFGATQTPWREYKSEPSVGERLTSNRTGHYNSLSSSLNSFWNVADWLRCRDDRWRPVEPGTFPLAHGAANRVGRLRGYGNAIVAPQAEEFIRVAMEYAP